MSHTLKLLLKILLTRIRSKIKPEISETQFGFVANKGTTNAVFTMMMLMERARGIEHLAMTGKIDGKKSCGRQRTTYVDSLNTWANLEQHSRSQFMRSSCERQIWKTMTVNACSRHGT
ncbi:RNA-directed DNA polymerase from mobile element jockey-like [Elysia marginata]|uniref:RNA-directed DNA polymerase from mobile element jockey-like n=1 Tax=Elysia marginata TaxID=1093978 RepID=A0AAV4I9R2_9GAST|nr:RNA-directed DNA polymerase from mobile element jockey-like [Elysia marginata]